MSYREQFIAAWVTQQQRAFHQSARGIMTPEDRQILEDEAEKAIAEVERAAAEKAWDRCVGEMPVDPDWKNFYGDNNPYRAAALGLTAEQEGEQR